MCEDVRKPVKVKIKIKEVETNDAAGISKLHSECEIQGDPRELVAVIAKVLVKGGSSLVELFEKAVGAASVAVSSPDPSAAIDVVVGESYKMAQLMAKAEAIGAPEEFLDFMANLGAKSIATKIGVTGEGE